MRWVNEPRVYVCLRVRRRRLADPACGFRSLSHLRERNARAAAARSQVRRRILRNEPAVAKPLCDKYENTIRLVDTACPGCSLSLSALLCSPTCSVLLPARSRFSLRSTEENAETCAICA